MYVSEISKCADGYFCVLGHLTCKYSFPGCFASAPLSNGVGVKFKVSVCGPRANRQHHVIASSTAEPSGERAKQKQFSTRIGAIDKCRRWGTLKLHLPLQQAAPQTAPPPGMKNIFNFLRFTHKYHKLIIRAASSMKRRFEFHFHLPFLLYLCHHIHLIKHRIYGRLIASIRICARKFALNYFFLFALRSSSSRSCCRIYWRLLEKLFIYHYKNLISSTEQSKLRPIESASNGKQNKNSFPEVSKSDVQWSRLD